MMVTIAAATTLHPTDRIKSGRVDNLTAAHLRSNRLVGAARGMGLENVMSASGCVLHLLSLLSSSMVSLLLSLSWSFYLSVCLSVSPPPSLQRLSAACCLFTLKLNDKPLKPCSLQGISLEEFVS